MKFRLSGLILSAAILGLAAPALADTAKFKPHKAAHVRHYDYRGAKPDLFPGSVVNEGSDNRYFSDTADRMGNTLPPGITQKFWY